MQKTDDWAIRLHRLRPPPPADPATAGRGRARRRTLTVPATVRRLLPLAVVAIGIWFAGGELPAFSAPPDPVTLAAQSRELGWNLPAENRDLAMDVFARVNDERAERGLPPLVWHPGLAELAGNWSLQMIQDTYGHSPADYLDHPHFAGAGENIAMGQRDTRELHVGWMESDGHRGNILRREFTAMGVGIVCRADGRMWATQVFGLPHGGPSVQDQPTPPVEPVVRRDPGVTCPGAPRTLPLG